MTFTIFIAITLLMAVYLQGAAIALAWCEKFETATLLIIMAFSLIMVSGAASIHARGIEPSAVQVTA